MATGDEVQYGIAGLIGLDLNIANFKIEKHLTICNSEKTIGDSADGNF